MTRSRLLAPVLVAGLVFTTLAVAQDAPKKAAKKADAVKDGEGSGLTFEIYADKGGKFRWRLVDQNKFSLAMTPRGYATKEECLRMVEAVKSFAGKAVVKEADAEK
jgi:uncharacterized protein YegP (UPF0339 family)